MIFIYLYFLVEDYDYDYGGAFHMLSRMTMVKSNHLLIWRKQLKKTGNIIWAVKSDQIEWIDNQSKKATFKSKVYFKLIVKARI